MQNPFQMMGPPAIGPQELLARLAADDPPFLLDVRDPDEYAGGHIAGTVLIPMQTVPQRVTEIPREREIVCICHSGARSGRVSQWLATQGYQAVNLRGGMVAWPGEIEV